MLLTCGVKFFNTREVDTLIEPIDTVNKQYTVSIAQSNTMNIHVIIKLHHHVLE